MQTGRECPLYVVCGVRLLRESGWCAGARVLECETFKAFLNDIFTHLDQYLHGNLRLVDYEVLRRRGGGVVALRRATPSPP